MSWGTIGSFFTPDTFLCAGDTSLPPLCPARDVLLPPALPTGWDAPKKILVASVQSLLPKFITYSWDLGEDSQGSGRYKNTWQVSPGPRAACEDEDKGEALVLSWQCCCSSGTFLHPTLILTEIWCFHQDMLELLVLF